MTFIVGSYRVLTTQYLLLVRIFCQGIFYLSRFPNFEVCNYWSPNLLSFSSRMLASRLSINFLPTSNASVNLTISSGGVQVTRLYNSSLGVIYVDNLSQDQNTLLVMTFSPSDGPTRLDLGSLTLTVPENA